MRNSDIQINIFLAIRYLYYNEDLSFDGYIVLK